MSLTQIRKTFLAGVPALFLAAACADSPLPTAASAGAARVEVVEQADMTQTCLEQIAELHAATVTLAISGTSAESKDRPGLLAKLDAAANAVSLGKPATAVAKLGDYRAKVEQLAAAGRIDPTVAAALVADADAAIACIEMLDA